MGVTKLEGFNGEAEILGQIRQVSWNQQSGYLTISSVVDLVEAGAILDALAVGKVAAVKLPGGAVKAKDEPKVHEQAAPSKPEKLQDVLERKIEKQTEEKLKKMQIQDVTEKTAPAESKPPENVVPIKPETKPAAEPAKEATAAVAGAPTAPPADLLAKVNAATKLKDVLAVLMDSGIKEPEQLVTKCEELKAQGVTLLSRVANMNDRVRRVLEVMAP